MRNLVLAILLLWAAPLAAADLAGHWKMTAEGRTALLLSLEKAPSGGWSGTITRPLGMSIDDGTAISELTGAPSQRRVAGSAGVPERAELGLDPAKEGEDQLRFIVTALDDNHAELVISFAGQASRPIAMRRAAAGEALASAWEKRTYRIDPAWPDNPEMTAMFEADQAARKGSPIDWAKLNPEDSRRRARTTELVGQGKLRSAGDFYAAAFIFQHGDQASDFLLAHTFALISAARGRPDASWIAAATLDRYLQKIGQPQIYGTQYFTRPNEPVTQEPYNRSLVSDALRAELGVPPISAQEERRKAIQVSRDAAAKSVR